MTVAKNDQQKGRSLEEQLASLDALSNEQDESSPAGEPAGAPADRPTDEPPNGEPPVPPNPWLNRPLPADESAAPADVTEVTEVTAQVPMAAPPEPPEPGPAAQEPARPRPAAPPPMPRAADQPPAPPPMPPTPPPPAPPSPPAPPAPDLGGPPPFSPQGFMPYGPPSAAPYGAGEPPAEQPTQVVQWADNAPSPIGVPPAYGEPSAYPGPPPYDQRQAYPGPPPYPQQGQAYPLPQQGGYPPESYQPPQSALPMPPANMAPPQPLTQQPPQPPPGWDSLSTENLLRDRRHAPAGGWRRLVYKASVGTIHPGESPAELRRRELIARACTPVAGGHHRVAVMSLKGGVGKTTTTVGLGSTLASLRGDRVIAVDANPDRGTLSDKVRLETRATVRDLVNERDQVQRYADVRAYTSQASSRLEVLASDQDPAVSEAFSEEDYRTVTQVLEHYYSICLTDCGTGLLHSAMAGVLSLADQLVLVSSPSVDGARSASATLDWLQAHGHDELVRGGVVVLSMVRPRSKSSVDLDRLQEHFEVRCRAVVRIPYDAHLEEGAEVELDQLSAATRDGYLQLAATVGDGFARPR
jgi:MinD-like ATPase involved in chromosome partitioning or flagellar assembly